MNSLFVFSPSFGYVLLLVFGLVMVAITYVFARKEEYKGIQGFLVAGRNVKGWLGAVSIAASWVWAPALFVSVQFAYQKGLAGIFWFTFPNMVALALFAFLAPKIRQRLPYGYTLPQWIRHRLGSDRAHKVYLFPYFFYQVMAVTVQLFAGGNLLSALTGIPLINAMALLAVIALAYSFISGLGSSIVTDLVQFVLIIAGIAVVVPWAISAAGGLSQVAQGFGGLSGQFGNIFSPSVAFSFGIVTAIGLISGAISDQQYWQRAFAIKKKNLVPSFIFGAVIFGIVPIALSVLGFLAANGSLGIVLPEGMDAAMIGVATVRALLPAWATVVFVVMLLGGLSSTLDSGLNAAASLWATDVMKRSREEKELLAKFEERKFLEISEERQLEAYNRRAVRGSKAAMVAIAALGFGIALLAQNIAGFGLQHLWWIFNTVAACVVVPTVLSLYWERLSARGVLWGVIVAFFAGLPLFVWANMADKPAWIVASSLGIIGITTAFCLLMPSKKMV